MHRRAPHGDPALADADPNLCVENSRAGTFVRELVEHGRLPAFVDEGE